MAETNWGADLLSADMRTLAGCEFGFCQTVVKYLN